MYIIVINVQSHNYQVIMLELDGGFIYLEEDLLFYTLLLHNLEDSTSSQRVSSIMAMLIIFMS